MTTANASTNSQSTGTVRNGKSTKRTTDAQLLEYFLTRDDATAERAFTRLVKRHGSVVQRVCFEVLGDRHEAEDAAQAVFLVLARKARSIRKPDSLGSWLHGVALRTARRARIEGKRRRETERRAFEATARRIERGELMELSDHPELRQEIDRLPDRYRLPIVLCYYEGYTQEEAARVLGWPYGTVQTRLHRGRRMLRERLERGSAAILGVVGATLAFPSDSIAADLAPGWAETTARAAVRFSGGGGVGEVVAPSVAQLAGSVLASMVHETLRASAFGALAVGIVVAGLAFATFGGQAKRVKTPAVAEVVPKPQAIPVQTKTELKRAKAIIVEAVAPPAPTPSPKRIRFAPVVENKDAVPSPLVEVADGRALFERNWSPNDSRSHGGDGLGPVFNARSCVDCHDQGGTGGAGRLERNIEIATADAAFDPSNGYSFFYAFSMDFGDGKFNYQFGDPAASSRSAQLDPTALAAVHPGFRGSRSVMLHRFGVDPSYPAWRQSIPGRHGSIMVRTSQRNPTPLFGVGLIDAIPDEAIVSAARHKFQGAPQLSGRVGRMPDGRIGRFGWKSQTATLREFVLSAAAGELGLTVADHPQADDPRQPGLGSPGPDMNQDESDALTAFVRDLPRPSVYEPDDEADKAMIAQGEKTFKSIGCASCHLPKLGDVEGIYSDLLLHDMSPELGDTGGYSVFVAQQAGADPGAPREEEAAARPGEWRTPPLWGLRDSAPYLHDGRAESVARAVLLHGGEGTAAAERFARLSRRRRQQLEAFLNSLTAPDSPRDGV